VYYTGIECNDLITLWETYILAQVQKQSSTSTFTLQTLQTVTGSLTADTVKSNCILRLQTL